jgi:nuclear GTP-binding protein
MHDPLIKKVKGKGKEKIPVDNALGAQPLLICLSQWAKEKDAQIVAVVGVANVRLFTVFCLKCSSSLGGKKFFDQFSTQTSGLPIYTLASSSRGPSTTEIPQEVTLEVDSEKIVLIDTPGFSFVSDEEAD